MRITKKYIKAILLLSIIVCIAVFLWNTDFEAVKAGLLRIGYRFLYLMGISFLAYWLASWSWYVCLGADRKKISLFRLFPIRQVAETVGQYNPSSIIAGDLFKAELLKPYGISRANALQSVATSRITIVLSQILLVLIACIWLLSSRQGQHVVSRMGWIFYLVLAILILGKVGLFIWLSRKDATARPADPDPSESFWRRWKAQVQAVLWDIRAFYQDHTSQFWYSYFLAAIHWIVGSLEFYFILIFLSFQVHPMDGLLLDMCVIVFKSFGAFIPGQLGVEELGNKLMLSAIGIGSGGLWITVSILRRARQVCWIGIGFLLYLFIKKTINHAKESRLGSLVRKS